jgi:hypothetical protein
VLGQLVQVRCLDPIVSISRERVIPLLIGQDEQDVWIIIHGLSGIPA